MVVSLGRVWMNLVWLQSKVTIPKSGSSIRTHGDLYSWVLTFHFYKEVREKINSKTLRSHVITHSNTKVLEFGTSIILPRRLMEMIGWRAVTNSRTVEDEDTTPFHEYIRNVQMAGLISAELSIITTPSSPVFPPSLDCQLGLSWVSFSQVNILRGRWPCVGRSYQISCSFLYEPQIISCGSSPVFYCENHSPQTDFEEFFNWLVNQRYHQHFSDSVW